MTFMVRRRGNGFAVWDTVERMQVEIHDTKDAAEKDADKRNNAPRTYTFGLTYYVEVDAADEADAVKKSKRFFTPSYRENWDPVEVTKHDGPAAD